MRRGKVVPVPMIDTLLQRIQQRDDKQRPLRQFIARRRNGAWHVHVDGGYGCHADFRSAYLRAVWGL